MHLVKSPAFYNASGVERGGKYSAGQEKKVNNSEMRTKLFSDSIVFHNYVGRGWKWYGTAHNQFGIMAPHYALGPRRVGIPGSGIPFRNRVNEPEVSISLPPSA